MLTAACCRAATVGCSSSCWCVCLPCTDAGCGGCFSGLLFWGLCWGLHSRNLSTAGQSVARSAFAEGLFAFTCDTHKHTHTHTQTQKQADTPARHSVTLTCLRLLCLLCLVLHPQILITAGGRFGVASIVLSLSVRLLLDAVRRMRRRPAPSSSTPWSQVPPPWLAVFVGVLPAQLTRLLVRTGNWNKLAEVFGFVVAFSWRFCGSYLFYGVLYAVSFVLYMSACLVTTLLAGWVVTPLIWLQLPLGGLKRKILRGPEDALMLLSGLIQEQLDQDWRRLWFAVVFYASPFLPSGYFMTLYGDQCLDEALLLYGLEAFDYDFMSDRSWNLVDALDASKLALRFMPHSWWLNLLLFVWLGSVLYAVRVWDNERTSSGRDARQSWQRRWQQWWHWWAQPGRGSSTSGGGGDAGRSHRHAGSGPSAASDDDSDGEDELAAAEHEFPMGFRAVAVPPGCKVATVKAVLQAADYYRVCVLRVLCCVVCAVVLLSHPSWSRSLLSFASHS